MKCKKCGTEFEGKNCPNCGQKKKKPFYFRWWFILLTIIVIAIIALESGSGGEKIVWKDIILGEMLPSPPAKKGKIHDNSSEKLWIDINELSDKQYSDYINACKEKGFTVDEKSDTTGLSPKFKTAMDSYENFMDEYVNFMRKYKANPNDLGLLSDYADYMDKYTNFVKDFEKWESKKLSTAEATYYIKVQARVSRKLLKVSK